MNIKDFIIEGGIPEKEKTIKRNATEYTYILDYENDTDFILTRTTANTKKQLVCLVSQGQIYIKDVKQNTIENVTNISQINSFKQRMVETPNFTKLTWQPFKYYNHKITAAFENLIEHKESYRILSNKKLNPFKNSDLVYYCENNPELMNSIEKTTKIMKLFCEEFSPSDFNVNVISHNLNEAKIDYNLIKANLDVIKELTPKVMLYCLSFNGFYSCIRDYGCDFKTLLKYLLYTITYRNGLRVGDYYGFRLNDYLDYLRMQREMYGKPKEKYPAYWLSEKQMMVNKYNKWIEIRNIKGFNLGQETLKKIEFEDDVYKVVIPLKSTDILDEAQQQQHCVASYIDKISRGETHIVFIRQKLNEEESCLTVEITPDYKIIQVRGFQNRDYTASEYAFMKKWAEARNLKLEVREIVCDIQD